MARTGSNISSATGSRRSITTRLQKSVVVFVSQGRVYCFPGGVCCVEERLVGVFAALQLLDAAQQLANQSQFPVTGQGQQFVHPLVEVFGRLYL